MPLLLLFVVLFSALNAIWAAFAVSGLWLMAPGETMGTLAAADTDAAQVRLGLECALWTGLAAAAWARSRVAVAFCTALVPVKVFGWVQAAQMADAMPEMPAGAMAIWAVYRAMALVVLLVMAAYLWRMAARSRLA